MKVCQMVKKFIAEMDTRNGWHMDSTLRFKRRRVGLMI